MKPGPLFLGDVKELRCPTLAAGNLVIWDNLSVHAVAGVCEAIEARGAMLQPRPPYRPDLHPIEQVCAKLKAQMRAASAHWKTLG